MDELIKYYVKEEYKVSNKATPYIPDDIIAFGTRTDEEWSKVECNYSPEVSFIIRIFYTSAEYNQYIREARKLGIIINSVE